MKKKWVIIGAIVAAVIVVVVLIVMFAPKKEAYMLENSSNSAEKAQTETPAPTEQSATAQPAAQPGRYVDYTDNIIANTPGTKVLFFHASWCPQCRALDASIKAGKIPDGVTIIKVDYDTHEKLRQKYGVTVQTTLVRVDDNGNLVKKFIAYSTPNLEALIKNVL